MGGTPRIMAKATTAELTESREATKRAHAHRGVLVTRLADPVVAAVGEEVKPGFGWESLFQENWEVLYNSTLSRSFSAASLVGVMWLVCLFVAGIYLK